MGVVDGWLDGWVDLLGGGASGSITRIPLDYADYAKWSSELT